jgi:hypothetical protein
MVVGRGGGGGGGGGGVWGVCVLLVSQLDGSLFGLVWHSLIDADASAEW